MMCTTTETTTQDDPDDLILELKPFHHPRLFGTAGCETWSVCFSPDGSRFAWSMGYGVVKVLRWRLTSNNGADSDNSEDKTLNCEHTVWGMAFGPRLSNSATAPGQCGKALLLVTGLSNGLIKVWAVSSGTIKFDWTQVCCQRFGLCSNGSLTLVSASRDKTLRIWDLAKKGAQSHVLTGPNYWLFKCSVSPDSSMIASVCNLDSKAYLWSLRSRTLIRVLKYDHERTMISCDFSMDGALLAIGSYHATTGWWLDLWDPYTADHLTKIEDCDACMYKNDNLLTALSFSPVAPQLAFKDYRALQIWDMEQDKLVFESDRNRVSGICCAFHPLGSIIATGCRDGHVKFWRVPRLVPSLRHLCRTALRNSVSTFQVRALPLPKKLMDFLTYRTVPKKKVLRCTEHYSRGLPPLPPLPQ